jgi:U3 small nucleolar RNA-associated protein 21
MSQCGTFAVIGSAGGAIDMFNMQSGLHRQSFPPPLPKSRKLKVQIADNSATKHTKAVTGLMIDNLNRTVISCGLDGKVKVRSPLLSPSHFSYLVSLTSSLN